MTNLNDFNSLNYFNPFVTSLTMRKAVVPKAATTSTIKSTDLNSFNLLKSLKSFNFFNRFIFAVCLIITLVLATPAYASPNIPELNWVERSDWLNVKTDVTPAAVGDGKHDDTEAIQAALNRVGENLSVYLPPGTYRITRTLTVTGPVVGVMVVGHGRTTRIVWDGEKGGRMFWSNGAAYSSYIGLTWDGKSIAAVGFDHASKLRFETEIKHQHEAFLNFTESGIRIGHEQKYASAEILYDNCLFENCRIGVALLSFNDYNNTFNGCEFRNCDYGIYDEHGNFYARNCHFENSRESDFYIGSEHNNSIRRCTSKNSRSFVIERQEKETVVAAVTIQDCHVAGWTNPAGAVILRGAPVLIFDSVFSDPPGPQNYPIRVQKWNQYLILSNNRSVGTKGLVKGTWRAHINKIPAGKRKGVVKSAEQSFLKEKVLVPTKIFDAKQDFGAIGDGKADDTTAIQAAIDGARKWGKGALAYLPSGRYRVTKTIRVTGKNYSVGGAGFLRRTSLVWDGPEGGVIFAVHDPMNVTMENLTIGHHDLGPMDNAADIRQTSSGRPSSITYDGIFAHGIYQSKPLKQGLEFVDLPHNAVVRGAFVQGNLRLKNCSRATILFNNSYGGSITIEGSEKKRDGFLGFMTRLATITEYTLKIKNNHSVVMSDFYNEQSDSHIILEGGASDPLGTVTIQGGKTHLRTQNPVVEIENYSGRVVLGPNQFYVAPVPAVIAQRGDRPVDLILLGNIFYKTEPEFRLSENGRLALIGNEGWENTAKITDTVLASAASGLDDLRRLGEIDYELNHTVSTQK